MGKNSRRKEENRMIRDSLKRVLDNRLYFVATPNGGPLTNPIENVVMTWVRPTRADCQELVESLQKQLGVDLQVGDMPLGTYLGALAHHLLQADLDLIQVEDDQEGHLPISTWGVAYMLRNGVGEKWDNLLQESRRFIDKNSLLLETFRQVIKVMVPPADQAALLGVQDDELIRAIMGKRSGLPTVDLRTVWVLAHMVPKEREHTDEDGNTHTHTQVVPETLMIDSAYNAGEDPISIGPIAFSSRDRVEKWALQLHPKLQEQLSTIPVVYQAYRIVEFVEMSQVGYAPILPDGCETDSFCFDGGLLPFTTKGAQYADKVNLEQEEIRASMEENPNLVTFERAIERNGLEDFRKWIVVRTAAFFGFEVMEPEAPAEETPDGLESAVVST